MKPKKTSKPIKQVKAWQKKIEERVIAEGVKLEHPKGKERFEKSIKRIIGKK